MLRNNHDNGSDTIKHVIVSNIFINKVADCCSLVPVQCGQTSGIFLACCITKSTTYLCFNILLLYSIITILENIKYFITLIYCYYLQNSDLFLGMIIIGQVVHWVRSHTLLSKIDCCHCIITEAAKRDFLQRRKR